MSDRTDKDSWRGGPCGPSAPNRRVSIDIVDMQNNQTLHIKQWPPPPNFNVAFENECTGECTLNSNPPKAKAAVLNFNIEIWAVGRQRFLLSSVWLFSTSTEWKFLFRRNKLFVAKRIFGEVVVCCISARGVPLANILNYFLESGPYVYVQKASDLRCLLSMTASPRVEAAHRQHEAMSVSPVLP